MLDDATLKIMAYNQDLEAPCECGDAKGHPGWLICALAPRSEFEGDEDEQEARVLPASWCPHCAYHVRVCRNSDGTIDRSVWTDEERDLLREHIKRTNPAIVFAPSTANMAARFGHLANEKGKRERR